MFGLGKPTISADHAVRNYIGHTADVANDSYKVWLLNFIEGMPEEIVPLEITDSILKQNDVKLIHFCALCAIDAIAIKNIFEADTASVLYESLDNHIRNAFTDGGDYVADTVFRFIGRIEAQLKDMSALPNDASAFYMMELLGFDNHPETKKLFDSPLFVMKISAPLIASTGFWKTIRETYKIKI